MFQVLKTKDREYIIKTDKNSIFCSSVEKAIDVLRELGMKDSEIESGLKEMVEKDHNYMDVGFYKTWLYTKKVA